MLRKLFEGWHKYVHGRRHTVAIEPLIILLLLALLGGGAFALKGGLGGGFLTGFSINQNQIDAAQSGYEAFQVFEVRYRCTYDNSPAGCRDSSGAKIAQNRCQPNVHATFANFCAERGVVLQIQALDKAVVSQFAATQTAYNDCVTAGGGTCSGAAAAFKALQAAIAAAKAFGVNYGYSGA